MAIEYIERVCGWCGESQPVNVEHEEQVCFYCDELFDFEKYDSQDVEAELYPEDYDL